jgi:hypothetical protein
VRDTTKLWGGVGKINCCLKGSQALPASPSGRVEIEFDVKYSNLMWRPWRYGDYFGTKFEKFNPLGGLHGKHAVQRGIWIPTQHLLWD